MVPTVLARALSGPGASVPVCIRLCARLCFCIFCAPAAEQRYLTVRAAPASKRSADPDSASLYQGGQLLRLALLAGQERGCTPNILGRRFAAALS